MQSKIWCRASPSPEKSTTCRLLSVKFSMALRASMAILRASANLARAVSSRSSGLTSSTVCSVATGTLFLDELDHTMCGITHPVSV
jgi:hypothetical protein